MGRGKPMSENDKGKIEAFSKAKYSRSWIAKELNRRKLKATLDYMYNDLFCRGEGSDVTLLAFGKFWNLHKICLSRVDYFKNMFGGTWSESEKNLISLHFSDELITEEAFAKTMETLYCDEIEITNIMAPHLLAASSWFGMVELINLTTTFLAENLTLDSVVQNYALADKYNCQSLRENCIEFLAYNIFIKSSAEILREISVELMKDVLSSPSLCVLHLEQDVYHLLRKWLYLKLFPECQKSFEDLNESILSCFSVGGSLSKDQPSESFLESEIGRIFCPAFQPLRLDHAICSKKFCELLKSDNIVPTSWKIRAYENQWGKLIRNMECRPTKMRNIDARSFESCCQRCGRMFKKDNKYCWRWVGFNFGCDLIFSWHRGILRVKRSLNSSSSIYDSCSFHNFFYRIDLFSLNDCGKKTYESRTAILQTELDLYSNVFLMSVDEGELKYPLYMSCKFFHPAAPFVGCESSSTTKSIESLSSRAADFDTISVTISFEEDNVSELNDTEEPQQSRSSTIVNGEA